MSRRKDRERAESGKPFLNIKVAPERPDDDKEAGKCFLCSSSIFNKETKKLTNYAQSKPKYIIGKELGKIRELGGGDRDRICSKCYREKVENG